MAFWGAIPKGVANVRFFFLLLLLCRGFVKCKANPEYVVVEKFSMVDSRLSSELLPLLPNGKLNVVVVVGKKQRHRGYFGYLTS